MFDILCLDILDIYAIKSFFGGEGGVWVSKENKENKENHSIIHRLITCGG